jgi:hypothetical protein
MRDDLGEEAVGLIRVGFGKYVLLITIGILLISAGTIISSARGHYLSSADPNYDHVGFASSVISQLGILFVTLPLVVGGISRDDIHLWIRVIMIVMGCLLLGARFA